MRGTVDQLVARARFFFLAVALWLFLAPTAQALRQFTASPPLPSARSQLKEEAPCLALGKHDNACRYIYNGFDVVQERDRNNLPVVSCTLGYGLLARTDSRGSVYYRNAGLIFA